VFYNGLSLLNKSQTLSPAHFRPLGLYQAKQQFKKDGIVVLLNKSQVVEKNEGV
jgi:hypothetical protein